MSRPGGRLPDPKDVSAELMTLTYGALVTQMLKDYEKPEEVNKQLDRMGYNIGVRIIEDFLARTGAGRCNDFKETADRLQVQLDVQASISQDQLKCDSTTEIRVRFIKRLEDAIPPGED
ncbi:unnamed protein product [Cyprideis torosa]|uniref:Uncharacterized protein n=1 Tax=Cyprideis torosa TaxID=163714 RepID=A0A7R8W2T3_9CRUS|nr:unnamed protein product [Cyprideis torosa]CAG0881394.1 unnamed protein product [Cyprideis torosa]